MALLDVIRGFPLLTRTQTLSMEPHGDTDTILPTPPPFLSLGGHTDLSDEPREGSVGMPTLQETKLN